MAIDGHQLLYELVSGCHTSNLRSYAAFICWVLSFRDLSLLSLKLLIGKSVNNLLSY